MSLTLSKEHGVNSSVSCCEVCGAEIGVVLFGASYKDQKGKTAEAKALNSAAGELKSRRPRWIVDIDSLEDKEKAYQWLIGQGINKFDINEIPTNQCCHFITPKFNLGEFMKAFPHIDVHKNSMGTLLYMPNLNQ